MEEKIKLFVKIAIIIVIIALIVTVGYICLKNNTTENENTIQMYDFETGNTEELNISDGTNVTTTGYVPNGIEIANETDTIDMNELYREQAEIEEERTLDNVTLEIDQSTVTPLGLTLVITDNNEMEYGWGADYAIQQKLNGEWEQVPYIVDESKVAFIAIAYVPDENNQIHQEIEWQTYYGELSGGIYRIEKRVYTNGEYVSIYSDEFEIE